MKILCLGWSYTGRYLSANFPEQEVFFLSRRSADLETRGFLSHKENDSSDSHTYDLILDCVPPEKEELPYRSVVESLLSQRRIPYVHISATSVFGENSGEEEELLVFDELSAVCPSDEKGEARVKRELMVREVYGARIVRSTGIYGPGRCLALQFQSGNFERARSGNRMVSRIHVHDLCRLILAVSSQEKPLLHAVDTKPSSNLETFVYLEELLGISVPGNWRDQRVEGRIIRSLYALSILSIYRFPTYREGFRDCLLRTEDK